MENKLTPAQQVRVAQAIADLHERYPILDQPMYPPPEPLPDKTMLSMRIGIHRASVRRAAVEESLDEMTWLVQRFGSREELARVLRAHQSQISKWKHNGLSKTRRAHLSFLTHGDFKE